MTPLIIGILFTILLFVLIGLRVPVAVSMLVAAIGGILVIQGWRAAAFQLGAVPFASTAYALSVVPLFVLMGAFAARTGLARELYDAANAMTGHRRGGLAMGTVAGCAGFSTICGSSLATAATMGGVSLKEMARYGYDNRLSSGAVAAGGTIGILIPPSVILVIYAILTEQSVGALFAAGLLPGILLTALFMVTIWLWARLRPGAAPRSDRLPWRQRLQALAGIWAVLLLVLLVIGGIYTGFFTPTESAGIGAFGTFLIGLARRRFTAKVLIECLLEASVTTAMIFLIIFGSTLFSTFLTVTGITQALTALTSQSGLAPITILLLMLAVLMVLGCFMDSLGIVLLTVPVFFPVLMTLDFGMGAVETGIWFGILLVMTVEMGLITPPVGMNVFIVRGVAPDIPIGRIYAGVLPFLVAFLAAIALILLMPEIALWLPGLLG